VLAREPVRPAHARAAAERFCLRNGLVEIGQVSLGTARYLIARLGFVVEADRCTEDEVTIVLSQDGGEPGDSLALSEDVAAAESIRGQTDAVDIAGLVAERARAAVRHAARPLLSEISQRHAHAHAQIVSLAAAQASDAAEVDLVQLAAARDVDLDALSQRFAARVTCTRVSCSWIIVPIAMVSVTLRRRKSARTIMLRVPAGAKLADKLRCEACGNVATAKPAACDDHMHLLCEGCAPMSQGRISCPLCM
jgi:hypothetical protein